jgi:hypothetical protein
VGGSGLSFTYSRRGFRVSGFAGNVHGLGSFYPPFGSSYGYSQRQVIVQTVVTPIIVQQQAPNLLGPPPDVDVSGVDLDVIRPSRRFGNGVEKVPEKVSPPPEAPLPGIDISKPKAPQRPDDRPPQPPPPPRPPVEVDKRDPDDPWRLMDLGRAAFAQQEFGKAVWRFGQVTEVSPNMPLGYFLRAQAEFALGKHRLAVRSIEDGLRRKPDWPQVKTFRPRMDLYKGNEAEFDAHLGRLGDALKERPKESDLLFLYAYQLWFDGRRPEALPYLERARATAADPTFIDQFLREAGWKVASK